MKTETILGKRNSIARGGALLGMLALASGNAHAQNNQATGFRSFIGGGQDNTASAFATSILGGVENTASGANANVLGGQLNLAAGGRSGIFTGFENTVTGAANNGAILTGAFNTVSGNSSAILSGSNNSASGQSSLVLTGQDNSASADEAVVGGRNSRMNGDQSFLWGSDINYSATDSGLVYLADNSRGGVQEAEGFGEDNRMFCRFDNGLQFFTHPTNNQQNIRIDDEGRVGINTGQSALNKGQVEINGELTGFSFSNYRVVTDSATNNIGGPFTTIPVSLYASDWICGDRIMSFSDERIKSVEGISDASGDLETLRKIEITDYTYIDKVRKGTMNQKKVIAQQVERVYPQAVSKTTDLVPDIYEMANMKDGWIELATDLKTGDRVRLIGEEGTGIYEVLETREGGFRTKFTNSEGEVFVFGREVDDFRNVDYDALAMLNISATQEIARKLESKEMEIAQLKAEKDAEIAKLVSANEAMAEKFAELLARDAAREERLVRLEQSLGGEHDAATVSVSLSASE